MPETAATMIAGSIDASPRPARDACPPGGDKLCVRRQRLVIDHGKLAAHIAGIYCNARLLSGHPADDVAASAGMGLVDAARLYDFEAEGKFSNFAYRRIFGQIVDDRRQNRLIGPSGRDPLKPRLGVRWLDAPARSSHDGSSGNGMDGDCGGRLTYASLLASREKPPHQAHDDTADLQRATRCLPRVHREAIRLRYQDDLTIAEVGHRLGCGVYRVYQLVRESSDIIRRSRGC